MQNAIYLSKVLSEIKRLDSNNNPIPFTITVRTFNNQNKTGGKLVTYHNAVLMQAPKTPGKIRLSQSRAFKNPKHFDNRTRNIKTDQGIKKINILFIIKYNGLDVV